MLTQKNRNRVIRHLKKLIVLLQDKRAQLMLIDGKKQDFILHVMDNSFDYQKFDNKPNEYFQSFGFNDSMAECEYYSQVNGIKSNLYLSYSFYYLFMLPYLNYTNKFGFGDKNSFRRLLGANNPLKQCDFRMAKQISYNSGGQFFDSNDEPCSREKAIELIIEYQKDLIIKPSLNSTWGKGVQLITIENQNESSLNTIFDEYKKDFSIEERIIQHPDLATFNTTSLNTIRILTYRDTNDEIRPVAAVIRFGKQGAVIDNASAGGHFSGISIKTGQVDRNVRHYKQLKTEKLPDTVVEHIPYFDKLCKTVTYLHKKMPYLNLIGWDTSVDINGTPIIIEFNSRPGIELNQIATGPVFTKDDLNHLLPLMANYSVKAKVISTIKYPGRELHEGLIR